MIENSRKYKQIQLHCIIKKELNEAETKTFNAKRAGHVFQGLYKVGSSKDIFNTTLMYREQKYRNIA